MAASFSLGLTSSIFLARSTSLGFERRLLISLSSDADLITTPLFLVVETVASTGLISIATAACLFLDEGTSTRTPQPY